MLSFFSKKKHSPPGTPPEEVIPGPEQDPNGDEFIFIERKPGNPQNPGQASGPVYPPMPQAPYGLPYPMSPYQSGAEGGRKPVASTGTPVPYIQGVPFELAPELSTTDSLDTIQLQVDGILAVMTRQISIDEHEAYNFALERSVKSESEAY